MNILNGTEAFAALAAGQQIECRHVEAGEFDDIRNFPATVYFNPEFEFRIAIKFFHIGEMQVPEPVHEAPAKGVQCFVPSILTEALSRAFKWKNSDSDLSLMKRGQIHLVQEHAETHALALIAVSGGSIEAPEEATLNDDEEKASTESTEQQSVDTTTEASSSVIAENNDVETSSQLKSDYMVQLTSAFELHVIEDIANKIESDTQLTDIHKDHLANFVKARQKVLRIDASKVVEKSTQTEAPALEVFDESVEYQILLNDLIDRARESQTPAEANALVKYTSTWTEEQRKPLINAIHVRLDELNPLVKDASLSVRISKAMDLTELDTLEIDVSACDEFIQPKLMEMVNKRRAELDPFFNPLGNAS